MDAPLTVEDLIVFHDMFLGWQRKILDRPLSVKGSKKIQRMLDIAAEGDPERALRKYLDMTVAALNQDILDCPLLDVPTFINHRNGHNNKSLRCILAEWRLQVGK